MTEPETFEVCRVVSRGYCDRCDHPCPDYFDYSNYSEDDDDDLWDGGEDESFDDFDTEWELLQGDTDSPEPK